MFSWLQAQLMTDGINALQDVGFVAELQQGPIGACFWVVNGVDQQGAFVWAHVDVGAEGSRLAI